MIYKRIIYTIGHSTRTIESFIELLKEYEIQQIIDVRTIPRSRYNSQFNKETLPGKLKSFGIEYLHIPELGGLRHTKKDSINKAWKNSSFRGFADYMQTKEFDNGLKKLIKISREKTVAIICAEAVPWRCHRSLIADALTVRKIKVIHIINSKNFINHKLTPFAEVKNKNITYPLKKN